MQHGFLNKEYVMKEFPNLLYNEKNHTVKN